MLSVSNSYIQGVLSYLQGSNDEIIPLQYEEFCQKITNNKGRITVEDYACLLNLGAKHTQDSLFGFSLGREIQTRDYGVLGYLVETCENLAQAIDVLIRFDTLVADIGQPELSLFKDSACMSWTPYFEDCRHMVLRNTTAWIATVRKIMGTKLAPSRVSFTFNLSETETKRLEDWFQCMVIANDDKNRIVFPCSYLSTPFSSENRTMFSALQQLSETELGTFDKHQDTRQQVVTMLAAAPHLRGTSLDRLATALFISSRTLQRQLKKDGVSYSTLLDNERKARVDGLLADLPLSQVAFELGYQEQSSFTHAFKKWFGKTPLQRKQELIKINVH